MKLNPGNMVGAVALYSSLSPLLFNVVSTPTEAVLRYTARNVFSFLLVCPSFNSQAVISYDCTLNAPWDLVNDLRTHVWLR